ncbi:MAG: sialidase family protein [Chloroflexota bacterium]
MVKRLLLAVTLLALVVVTAWSSVQKVASQPLEPYSPEWLALNHSMYDNKLTADWETRMQAVARASVVNDLDKWITGDLEAILAADVRMSTPTFSGNQNEFQLDINPTNHDYAIGSSNDNRTSGTGYYRTADGGATWFAADMPGIGSSCCDPGIAYSDDGVAYFANLDTSPAVFHITRSTDNGVTWVKMTDITPGDDRENIVVDNGTTSPYNGRIYVTYTDFGTTTDEIRLFYSDNGAVSWNGPINVSNVGGAGNAYPQSSQPRVANDGTVYVGFQYYTNGSFSSAQNRISKSTNGGLSFTTYTINAGPNLQGGLDLGDARGYFAINSGCSTFRHRSFPIIGVDPNNSNNVYAMWAGGNLETAYSCGGYNGRHSDILFSRSTDGGVTWSAPLKVNDDPSGKDQYYPWMDVSPDGTIYVGWHDRRDDTQNFRHVWYMDRSTNGGVSFGTDKRTANFRTLPTTFIGDYAGLAAENDLILPMWWDSRDNANGDPYTEPLHP